MVKNENKEIKDTVAQAVIQGHQVTIDFSDALVKVVGGTTTNGAYRIGRISLPESWIGKTIICLAVDSAEKKEEE